MTLSLTYAGFDYVAYYNGAYENANSLQSLAGTGANSVELSLDYGIDPQTNTVYADSNYTDSLTALGAEIQQAVGLGLSVMVRPLLDFVDPADLTGTPYSVGDWRSYYNPGPAGSATANAFFASYQTMILQEAQVAVANGATSLSIGAELDQITGPAYKGYWDSIISALRTDDPSLKLTYSADWDDALSPWQYGDTGLAVGTGNLATQISFASELDSIGIDEYAPISDAANPTLAQLIAGWTQTPTDPTTRAVTGNQSLISYLESVAAQIGKPLLFTELGYESANDAASQPSGSSTNVFDPSLQANLYQAFFDAWQQAGNSSLTGVYFWNWDPNASEVGPGNGANFSPQGLPAQAVAADFFGSNAVPPLPSTPALSPASDSGVQGDGITNVTTPVITGSGVAGDTVTLDDGATPVGTATVGSNGFWAIKTTSLADGVQSLTATQSDSGGYVSAASAPLSLQIDTIAPELTHDGPLSIAAGATAAIPSAQLQFSDNVSGDAQETYTVTTAPADGALLKNGVPVTSFAQADIDNGLISYHETATIGSASSDAFSFTVTDAAGNTTTPQQFSTQIAVAASGTNLREIGTGDFGASAFDVLWQSTGATPTIWLMNGNSEITTTLATPPAAWQIVGVGDFSDKPGETDLLWHIPGGGATAIWFMNGASIASTATLPTPPPSWNIATVADPFDTGYDNAIIWQNTGGATGFWLMNGGSVTTSGAFPTVAPTDQIVGAGDFYDTGFNDTLLLIDSVTNTPTLWHLNGANLASQATLPTPPASAWHFRGIGDFFDDGHNDTIVWQDNNDDVALWQMQGANIVKDVLVATPGAGWNVVGVADFNNNGYADLLLENTSTGAAEILYMQGTQLVSTAAVADPPAQASLADTVVGFGDASGSQNSAGATASITNANAGAGDQPVSITGASALGTPYSATAGAPSLLNDNPQLIG